MRKLPNIILTGTPGVGKTTTASQLISLSSSTPTPLRSLNVNELAKLRQLYESYDAELQTHVIDEEKLLDEVEKEIDDGEDEGGWVIDWHVCDLFPERWIDLVVVLRCGDTEVFWQRLATERKYEGQKLQENIDAEIFGVVADEAKEGYPDAEVVELASVEADDIDSNCERILKWVESWVENHNQNRARAEDEVGVDDEEG